MPKGLLDRRSEDVSITRKLKNGASVTYKSPEGSQMDLNGILGGMVDGYTPTPVSDNKQINVTPGEFVLNQPGTEMIQKEQPGLLEHYNNRGRQALAQGGWTGHKKMGYADGGPIHPSIGLAYTELDDGLLRDIAKGGGAEAQDAIAELTRRSGQQQTASEIAGLPQPNATTQVDQLAGPSPHDGAGRAGVASNDPYVTTNQEGASLSDPMASESAPMVDSQAPSQSDVEMREQERLAKNERLREAARQYPEGDPRRTALMNQVSHGYGNVSQDTDLPEDQAQVPPEQAMEVADEAINVTTKAEVVGPANEAGVDPEVSSKVGDSIGKSKSVKGYLAELNKQIDNTRDKQKKAMMLMFGLSLLGGESMATAAQVANTARSWNKEDLDQLLAQRNDTMNRLHADMLNEQGLWTPGVQDHAIKAQIDVRKQRQIKAIKDDGSGDVTWNTGDLKEAQAKALALGNEAITGAAEMTAIENSGQFDPSTVGANFRKALVTNKDGAIVGFKTSILNAMSPAEAAYLKATMKYITAKLRKESGAAISASEWNSEMTKLVPTNTNEFKYKQQERNRGVESLVKSSGAPSTEAFFKAAGFEEGNFDASTWASDVLGLESSTQVDIPPEIQESITEGKVVKFKNGQEWTRRNGKLVRLN